MDTELKVELEKLNGNLDRIFDRMGDLDKDVQALAVDIKEIKSDVAGQGKEIAKIQATMVHNLHEIQKIWTEIKSVWDHFQEHKKDIKEYVQILFEGAASENDKKNEKMKNRVLGSALGAAISAIGAAYAVITNLMAGGK